jgi:hypothetical protein
MPVGDSIALRRPLRSVLAFGSMSARLNQFTVLALAAAARSRTIIRRRLAEVS